MNSCLFELRKVVVGVVIVVVVHLYRSSRSASNA